MHALVSAAGILTWHPTPGNQNGGRGEEEDFCLAVWLCCVKTDSSLIALFALLKHTKRTAIQWAELVQNKQHVGRCILENASLTGHIVSSQLLNRLQKWDSQNVEYGTYAPQKVTTLPTSTYLAGCFLDPSLICSIAKDNSRVN